MEFASKRVTNIRNSTIQKLFNRVSRRKVGAPYLYQVTLEKIRRYRGATIRFDFPVTALIGTNGGGKSTVLGAAGLIYRSVAPRTFFAKSGKYDESMQDWKLQYEHWDLQRKTTIRSARYRKARWNRDPIDRPVVLLGVSRTLPATERKHLTQAISNTFEGVDEKPLPEEAQKSVEKILGRDVSSYIMIDIDGSGQEDRQIFASSPDVGSGYSEFHFGAGEASIIRIVQQIERAERGTLVLIEEIENGLHPIATRLLVDYLIDAADRKAIQVVFTTHSDSAIAGLPPDAVWACVGGNLSQGRLEVAALRALNGQVKVGAAIFVEDRFSEAMLESAIRAYCQRHPRVSPTGVGVYPVGGANRVVEIVKQHNSDPSIQGSRESWDVQGDAGRIHDFPAVAVLDGDCCGKAEFEKYDDVYYLPGDAPESYIFDAVEERLDSLAKILKKKLGLDSVGESEFIERVCSAEKKNHDVHMLFSDIGDEFDYISELDVRRAFLTTWCEAYPDVVDKLVGPLVDYFPDRSAMGEDGTR